MWEYVIFEMLRNVACVKASHGALLLVGFLALIKSAQLIGLFEVYTLHEQRKERLMAFCRAKKVNATFHKHMDASVLLAFIFGEVILPYMHHDRKFIGPQTQRLISWGT